MLPEIESTWDEEEAGGIEEGQVGQEAKKRSYEETLAREKETCSQEAGYKEEIIG